MVAVAVFVLFATQAATPLTTANTGLICVLMAGTALLVTLDFVGAWQRPGYSAAAYVLGVFAVPIASFLSAKGPFGSPLLRWWVVLLLGAAAVVGDIAWCERRSRGRRRTDD